MAYSKEMKTPLARLAYGFGLFELQDKASGNGKHYTCTLLFPKTSDIKPLKALIEEAATAEWKERTAQFAQAGLIKNPILDGDGPQAVNKKTGERHKGFEGHWFIRVASGADYPPVVVKRNRQPATKKDAYSGCWGYAVINAYTWENEQGGKGVSFGISGFQIAKDDESLGGASSLNPETAFDVIPDEGDAPVETKTGDGAAGLFG